MSASKIFCSIGYVTNQHQFLKIIAKASSKSILHWIFILCIFILCI